MKCDNCRRATWLSVLLASVILFWSLDCTVASAQRGGGISPAVAARMLLEKQLTDSAAKIVDAALAVDTMSAPLWNLKAKILKERGDLRGAEECLRRAITIKPDLLGAHQDLAEMFCDSGLTDSARKYIELPLRTDSANPRVVYFKGLILEKSGAVDTAVALYARVNDMLGAGSLIRIPVCPGYRMPASRLRSTGAGDLRLPTGKATLLLFWATWSPQSLKALKAILAKAPQSGISWNVLAVNVDRREWNPSLKAKIEAKAREVGYKGPVLIDSGLVLFDQLGLVSVPTVVASNLSGDVDELLSGWSRRNSHLVLNNLLSKVDTLSKSASRPMDTCDVLLRSLGLAWLQWEQSNTIRALQQVARSVRVCSTSAYPYALSAVWRWANGDRNSATHEAVRACAVDSSDAWGWLALAEIERRRARVDQCRDALARALAIDTALAPGWIIAGKLAADVQDTVMMQKSLQALQRVSRIDPGYPVLNALYLQMTGNWAEAAKVWRALIYPRI